MDFEFLRSGAVQIVLTFAAALNTTLPQTAPPVYTPPLQTPIILVSENLPTSETIQDLNSVVLETEDKLEMVTKEPEVLPSQDVMFYTVIQPTPKPTIKPKEKIELVKEAKAEGKKEDIKEPDVSPSPSPFALPTTSPTPAPALTDSNADKLFQMTNDHRAKIGKPPFEKDERICKIAQDRAPQVNAELSSGKLHAGFYGLNLPYRAVENIAAYQTIEQNFNFLINDYIHRVAIEGDYKYSCVACSGTSCSQIFTSFVEK